MSPVLSRLAALALLASVTLVGCGEGDEQDVVTAFRELRHAYLTQDYSAVCSQMSRAARLEVGQLGHERPSDCAGDLARNMSAAILSPRDRVDPEIEAVEVDGQDATVRALLGGTAPGTVRFVKQDGRWKLQQLFGTTAPPPEDLR